MAHAPLWFPGAEKEPPFNDAIIRKFITDLLVQSVEDVESDELEIKGWCRNERELADKVAEACSCIANTSGGYVLVGVSDQKSGPKFSRCPHGDVSTSWLRTKIYDLTSPPVECFLFEVSNLLVQETGLTGSNLFVIRVPKTRRISGHVTIANGVSKIRKGKQCHPQYVAQDDRTSVILSHISLDALSTASMDWGIRQHEKRFHTSNIWAHRGEFLAQPGLAKSYLPDEANLPEFHPSFAALLLFGSASAIQQEVGYFETVVETGGKHEVIRKNVIESIKDLCLGEDSILRSRLPQIPADVLKEVIVNAYIHRCYRTPGPIVISITESSLEIRSPGALLSGLDVSNLIYGVPVYRNLLLADGARFVGLCDKIGQGIDLIYQGTLSGGLSLPEFENSENLFVVRIPLKSSEEFKQFVHKRSQILGQLDEVVILSVLWRRDSATLDELSLSMQRKPAFAEGVLSEMCKKLMIEQVHYHSYRLSQAVRQDIQTIFQSDQLQLGLEDLAV